MRRPLVRNLKVDPLVSKEIGHEIYLAPNSSHVLKHPR